MPDSADIVTLPDGIWQPDPGLGRGGAKLIGDGANIWFLYARSGPMAASSLWLTKTSSNGEVLVPPIRIDGPENAAWPGSNAKSGDNVAAAWFHSAGTLPPRLRVFDSSGEPLSAEGRLVPMSTITSTYMTNLALMGKSDGSMRLFATHDFTGANEVVMVDLDAAGDPVGEAKLFGTADGGNPTALSAAVAADGSTLVAWDRLYDYCTGNFDPDATVLTAIEGNGMAAPITDIAPGGRSDREPTLASLGAGAYAAWTSETDAGSVIQIARASDPTVAVATVGNAAFGNQTPLLALSSPNRGAISWFTDEPAVRVASLADNGTDVDVGPPHVIPLASAEGPSITLRGIVHVGEERYVVSWTDDSYTGERSQLYALMLDLATMPKAASDTASIPMPVRTRSRRCTH
jgi:hypothetical protein